MKGLIALCALALCSCGDGRIVRALNSAPAYYPASTTDSDTTFKARMAELDAQQRQIEFDELRDKVNNFENAHPDLF